MKPTKTALDLHEFFPVALEIYDIVSDENQITIYMKSKSKECICPACGTISQKHHGTYHRRVQKIYRFLGSLSGWILLLMNINVKIQIVAMCQMLRLSKDFFDIEDG